MLATVTTPRRGALASLENSRSGELAEPRRGRSEAAVKGQCEVLTGTLGPRRACLSVRRERHLPQVCRGRVPQPPPPYTWVWQSCSAGDGPGPSAAPCSCSHVGASPARGAWVCSPGGQASAACRPLWAVASSCHPSAALPPGAGQQQGARRTLLGRELRSPLVRLVLGAWGVVSPRVCHRRTAASGSLRTTVRALAAAFEGRAVPVAPGTALCSRRRSGRPRAAPRAHRPQPGQDQTGIQS